MNDGGTRGHLLSKMPKVIMKIMMTYDFTGMTSHILRFLISIFLMRFTFLNSILTNMMENKIKVMMLPIIMKGEIVLRLIHETTPILQTLKPAISQMIPAMKASHLVFILQKRCFFFSLVVSSLPMF